ncbi:DUF695 domain-containing protein [Sporosarcina sp. FSL K6-1522]|uniref:DUF695 domain-containing protein n=1 Tax=Sporosarcina sp. FSL K6-1522 TaxID=2921554 RepID=UPI00315AC17E
MSKNWDLYFDYINEKVASIVLDMDVWKEIDTEKYRQALTVRLILQQPNADGFPSSNESNIISEIEVALKELVSHKEIINVGRITTDGFRDIIFYSLPEKQKDLVEAANQIITSTGYEFEVFSMDDEKTWAFYFDILYPNQYQQQHMGNRSVIDSLKESGDCLETPRQVDHWLYFEHAPMRESFVEAIKKEGFSIEENSLQVNEDGPYPVTIHRVDSVDYFSMNDVTDLLVTFAEEYNGVYDGWGTLVMN